MAPIPPSLDEDHLAAKPFYSFLPVHTTFMFVWTGTKPHAVFPIEKYELDLEGNQGQRGPDRQYQAIWALLCLDRDAQTWEGR